MSKQARYTGYLIPHTHWDREWYEPFQLFRARLVEVIDAVLEILDTHPDYRRFTLDGQAIVLEDYLEIRPEARERISQQVRSGRLRIGPWFVLADEFLVSPESLIRNLMLGREVCERFGPLMSVGYTPDSFGHISQLPLLLQGFGIDSVVFERGVGDEGEQLKGEFYWQAADEQQGVFAVHLLGTYSGATALGHGDWELSDTYDTERAVTHMRALLYGPEHPTPDLPEWLRDSFERLTGGVAAYSTTGALILLNGSDHLFPQRNIPEVIADLNAAFPEVTFIHSDVEAFVKAAYQPPEKLEPYQGEFRSSRYQHVLSGVLSSRLYLKQANHRCETLLERYVEPLTALAWQQTGTYQDGLIEHAWRLLLQNHPHDSICGCSVDSVHREMMTRFEGVEQLAEVLCQKAITELTEAAEATEITVFNPLPYTHEAVVTCALELSPTEAQQLVVKDAEGKTYPSQIVLEEHLVPGQSDRRVVHATVRFLAPLPPLGLRHYRLHQEPPAQTTGTVLKRIEHNGALAVENAHIRLEVNQDGSLTLSERASAQHYPLELQFEDMADAGDEYDFSPLSKGAPVYLSRPRAAPVVVESGPVQVTLRLEYELTLPERLSADRRQRIGETSMPITLELTVSASSRSVQLHGRLDNRAEDHRLRLLFRSGCHSEHVWADGHFDVLKRPTRPPEGKGWFQAPQPTNHQRRFVAVSDTLSNSETLSNTVSDAVPDAVPDGERGLAVLNRGLPEYEAIPSENGLTVAVTLLRAVGWLSRNDLLSRPQGAGPAKATPEAQCLGEQTFELALYPFSGPWWQRELLAEAQRFTAPPQAFPGRHMTQTAGFVEISGGLELSTFKKASTRESLILRVWNPAPEPVSGTLSFHAQPKELYRTRLDETRLEPISQNTHNLPLQLGRSEVQTFELVFDLKGVSDV